MTLAHELRLDGLTRTFGAVRALDAVSLALRSGEVHGLMGENGAGKSTLIRLLAGLDRPDSGRMRLDGALMPPGSPAGVRSAGLRFVHQELHIVPGLSVAENMHLDRSFPRRLGLVDWRALNRAAAAALARLALTRIDAGAPMGTLGPGDQMLVRIAGTLIEGTADGAPAWLYVMDEPTAALTGEESGRLFAVIGELVRQGAGVLYVSHRMPEVLRLADRVSVLRDGRLVSTRAMADTDQERIIREMTGRDLSALYPLRRDKVPGDAVLAVSDLTAPGVAGVSLTLRASEILGVAGLAGAGRGALLRAILGAVPRTGSVRLDGIEVPPAPGAAWARGLAYVPRERRSEGLMPRRSIVENVALPHLRRLARGHLFLDPRRQRGTAAALGREVRLRSAAPGQPCEELSGGNQQKVLFARALAGRPRVLLLDEPTRGVDVGAKADIYRLIRGLAGEGVAVLLASSDLPELIGLADRILILQAGRTAHVVEAAGMSEADLLSFLYDAPEAVA